VGLFVDVERNVLNFYINFMKMFIPLSHVPTKIMYSAGLGLAQSISSGIL